MPNFREPEAPPNGPSSAENPRHRKASPPDRCGHRCGANLGHTAITLNRRSAGRSRAARTSRRAQPDTRREFLDFRGSIPYSAIVTAPTVSGERPLRSPRKMKTLTCPYCKYSIPITWRRYWTSSAPWSSYKCPECNRSSKITTSPQSIQAVSHFVQIFVPLTFIPLFGSEHVWWLIPIMTAIFVIDRALDGRFGLLIPTEPKETPNGEQDATSNGG